MKIKNRLIILLLIGFFSTCTNEHDKIEIWKSEVIAAENEFSIYLSNHGIEKAFVKFADQSAVLLRNDSLIIGKESIAKHLKGNTFNGLKWDVTFVDVSKSGDFAYTYGNYTYLDTDSIIKSGIFHTVWKRQNNGNWKYVWD